MLPLLVDPTAQAFVGELTATDERKPAGLGTGRHDFPFQCKIKLPPLLFEPTAHALVGEVAATELRVPAGLVTRCHAFPFRCRINVLDWGWTPLEPTAHTFVGEVAATPRSCESAGLGLGTGFQCEPFQKRVSALLSVSVPE